MNFQMFMLDLTKAEEPEIKLSTSFGSSKKQESSKKKISIFALLNMPKPLTVCITTNCGKFWEMGIPGHLIWLLRNLYAGQETTVRTGHGPTNQERSPSRLYIVTLLICTFNLYAEYIMGNARLKAKLESRLLGEISITSDMQMTPSLWQKGKKN